MSYHVKTTSCHDIATYDISWQPYFIPYSTYQYSHGISIPPPETQAPSEGGLETPVIVLLMCAISLLQYSAWVPKHAPAGVEHGQQCCHR